MRDERLALRPGREMHTFYSYYGFSRNRKPLCCAYTLWTDAGLRRAPEQRRGGYPELMGHRAAIVIATAAPAPAPSQIGNGRSTPQSHDVENYQLQVRFKI